MAGAVPFLVFSDLDGTLIDHHSYEWEPARPALAAIREAGGGVILASSKTAVEIAALRDAMGLQTWPAIVENGAGILRARAAPPAGNADYARLREILDAVQPDLRRHFKGFGDCDAAGVAALTGLSLDTAHAAKTRAYSEPGLWTGSDAARAEFEAALQASGVYAREGGRFLTLSFGGTKADQMSVLRAEFAPKLTFALGDAPNDIEMLEAADIGVIIANPARKALPPLPGEAQSRIVRSAQPGPVGWNATMLALIEQHNLKQG